MQAAVVEADKQVEKGSEAITVGGKRQYQGRKQKRRNEERRKEEAGGAK